MITRRGSTSIERIFFLKHLSVLLGSGTPLPESLALLADQARSGRMRRTLQTMRTTIENGHAFSEALETSGLYPPYVSRVIHVGETAGRLEEDLGHLTEQLTKDMEVRRKVRGALLYPIMILVAAFALGAWIALFILPRLTRVFTSLDVPLPLSTRALLWVSAQLTAHWITIFSLIGVLAIGVALLFRVPSVGRGARRLLLAFPVLGDFIASVYLARVARTLGSLVRGGVPLSEALALTADAVTESPYGHPILLVRDAVVRGNTIARELERFPALFPPLMRHMIAVGERSGSLETLLFYVANFYEEEVDARARNFSTVIEPVLLVFLGLIVAWVGLSIVLPIARLYGSFTNR
ncbi:MAG: type II secretion system F family protein [Parcubacteria group bacterium]|nr:type II secretion system F family protein [Parcubacteria group bacterium]